MDHIQLHGMSHINHIRLGAAIGLHVLPCDPPKATNDRLLPPAQN